MKIEAIPVAEVVLGYLEAHPDQHLQETWRCSTGMCYAGWYGQLSGAQWVIDYNNPKHKELGQLADALAEYIYVPDRYLDHKNVETWTLRNIWIVTAADDLALKMAGIDPKARVMKVSDYTRLEMGIDEHAADILFDEFNTVEDLKAGVKHLANGQAIDWADDPVDDEPRIIGYEPRRNQ